jgi:hypothetical protein
MIFQDGKFNTGQEVRGLSQAIEVAEKLLEVLDNGLSMTYTVEDEQGYLFASVSNRRIIGMLSLPEESTGSKHRAPRPAEDIRIDATSTVLRTSREKLIELKDNDESTDRLFGNEYLNYVKIEESIKSFFGVKSLQGVTSEALLYARNNEYSPRPSASVISLSFNVSLQVERGGNLQNFIDKINKSILSETEGMLVIRTGVAEK